MNGLCSRVVTINKTTDATPSLSSVKINVKWSSNITIGSVRCGKFLLWYVQCPKYTNTICNNQFENNLYLKVFSVTLPGRIRAIIDNELIFLDKNKNNAFI